MLYKTSVSRSNFFQEPGWLLFFYVAASVVIWTIQCSLTQTILPLDAVETITWGGQWQWGNLKHPPLSGWIGYIFSCLSGYRDWSLYFAAELCLACGVWYIYRLGKEFFSKSEAATAALLLYTLYYYNPSTLKFCSHFLEIALLPAMSFYFYRGVKDNRMRDWILLGITSALACLGKYSAVQLFPAFVIWMLLTPERRKRFLSAGPYLSGISFLLLMAPHIYWLYQHDFGPILHLQERIDNQDRQWFFPLTALGTFLYPMVLEAVFLLGCILPWYRKTEKVPVRKDALVFSILMTTVAAAPYLILCFCQQGIILMWFSYLAGWTGMIVTSAMPWKIDFQIFKRLYICILALTAVMLIILTWDILSKTRFRCHADPAEIVAAAEKYYASRNPGKKIAVVYGERWIAGVIENYLPYRPTACVKDDICNLDLVREKIRRHGILLFSDNPNDFKFLFKQLGRSCKIDKQIFIRSKAPYGKERYDIYFAGYLPPDKTENERKD